MAVAPEEIRFAVVLNGGVSLAVWMGGVALELDRLTREKDIYGCMLNVVRCTARVDVITGTSAGGINGAALALSQVNMNANVSSLRELWVEQGRFEELLRPPFSGQPMSLLRGDEYFLPQLRGAFDKLTKDFAPMPEIERPIDLRITTTLLKGVPRTSYDDLGQELSQTIHQGVFSFRRDPVHWARPPKEESKRDDFKIDDLEVLVDRLAIAARSTASFPFAFEPSFVRVGNGQGVGDVASWYSPDADRSRFAVDGGVLVNTPTREALEAIDRMPADGPTRRVMLLVFPHAPTAAAEPDADEPTKAPTVVKSGGSLLSALYSQSGRTYVDKVEDHNRATASRRGGREDLLNRLFPGDETSPDVNRVYTLAKSLYDHYEDMRIRYAAREVTTRELERSGAAGWSFERVRVAAEKAQRTFGKLPYVPAWSPPADPCGPRGWPWGFTMAERLASATLDLLKRLVWVVTTEADKAKITTARQELHEARCKIRLAREELDSGMPESASGKLDVDYWLGRLTRYEAEMIGEQPTIGSGIRSEVEKIGDIVDEAQKILARLEPQQVKMAEVRAWKVLLSSELSARNESFQEPRDKWLSRLLALEISATCLADGDPTSLDQPVELVQVSLQTKNAFAKQSITPDDKAGGFSLARFSGFLKRSWRVNDWIWGRLDAATMLCKIVFDPERLRREDALEDDARWTHRERAETIVRGLANQFFGGIPADKTLATLYDRAVTELAFIYQPDSRASTEPSTTALAELAAWGMHVRIIIEELPALRSAIIADAADGANPRSRGELFLVEHEQLLGELPTLEDFEAHPADHLDNALKALAAFDRAGIGREELKDEAGSDQMIRTVATAVATTVTVLDSDKSGLGIAKSVTRALRGGTLLPYWMVTGLTKGSRIAQGLALLAGTLGVAMLVLAMFRLLPPWAIAPAATAGTGLLLGMFGYSALRSGTILHGLVLLTPMVPLGIYAVDTWWRARTNEEEAATATSAATGAASLIGIVAVAVVLIVLGSLPVSRKTPFALLSDTLKSKWRSIMVWLLIVAVVGVLVVVAVRLDFHTAVWAALLAAWGNAWLLVSPVVPAAVVATWQGRRLKVWRYSRTKQRLARARSEHAAATTAGWAAVYGTLFLIGGLVVRRLDFQEFDPKDWLKWGMVTTAFVMAGVLLLITTWLVPLMACRKIRRRLLGEASVVLYPKRTEVHADLPTRLEACGLTYIYLVKPKRTGSGLTLRWAGKRIAREIQRKLPS